MKHIDALCRKSFNHEGINRPGLEMSTGVEEDSCFCAKLQKLQSALSTLLKFFFLQGGRCSLEEALVPLRLVVELLDFAVRHDRSNCYTCAKGSSKRGLTCDCMYQLTEKLTTLKC